MDWGSHDCNYWVKHAVSEVTVYNLIKLHEMLAFQLEKKSLDVPLKQIA